MDHDLAGPGRCAGMPPEPTGLRLSMLGALLSAAQVAAITSNMIDVTTPAPGSGPVSVNAGVLCVTAPDAGGHTGGPEAPSGVQVEVQVVLRCAGEIVSYGTDVLPTARTAVTVSNLAWQHRDPGEGSAWRSSAAGEGVVFDSTFDVAEVACRSLVDQGVVDPAAAPVLRQAAVRFVAAHAHVAGVVSIGVIVDADAPYTDLAAANTMFRSHQADNLERRMVLATGPRTANDRVVEALTMTSALYCSTSGSSTGSHRAFHRLAQCGLLPGALAVGTGPSTLVMWRDGPGLHTATQLGAAFGCPPSRMRRNVSPEFASRLSCRLGRPATSDDLISVDDWETFPVRSWDDMDANGVEGFISEMVAAYVTRSVASPEQLASALRTVWPAAAEVGLVDAPAPR
jgi:hypothetical protein